jgi:hypothetical protein
MRQIPASELRAVIRFELQRLGRAAYRDMGSGHQGTRDRAIDTALDKILNRMKDWEIIVPDPATNIFRDTILPDSGPPCPDP